MITDPTNEEYLREQFAASARLEQRELLKQSEGLALARRALHLSRLQSGSISWLRPSALRRKITKLRRKPEAFLAATILVGAKPLHGTATFPLAAAVLLDAIEPDEGRVRRKVRNAGR